MTAPEAAGAGRRKVEAPSPPRADLAVVPVRDRADLDRFIRLPWRLYRDDPAWVPPLVLERRAHLSPRTNPYFEHAEVALWLALRDGQPVGRITAQVDREARRRDPSATGHFGFLEAEDDDAVFASLLGTAEAWLGARGLRRILGPLNFSINQEAGLLVEGFDTPPSFMMGHARPYYAARLEAQGYDKAKDLIAYDLPVSAGGLPGPVVRMVERLERDPRVRIRTLDRTHYDRDLRAAMEIFNDGWSGNWGFVPFREREVAQLARDLRLLIREDFVWLVEVDGEPAAFAVGLPNLNEAIADLDGALLPFGWLKLLYRLKAGKVRSGRLPLLGIRKRFHGTALGAALACAVMQRIHQTALVHGVEHGELSWILEDNTAIRKIIEACGARAYKTYRLYQKALG